MASNSAALLVIKCFNARTVAHLLHLQTRSYAVHKALNEFYDGIVGLADDFAEAYQGVYGIISDYPPTTLVYSKASDYSEGLKVMSDLRSWIQGNRKDIGKPEDTELQNIIDEIVGLIDSTTYKLKFLS